MGVKFVHASAMLQSVTPTESQNVGCTISDTDKGSTSTISLLSIDSFSEIQNEIPSSSQLNLITSDITDLEQPDEGSSGNLVVKYTERECELADEVSELRFKLRRVQSENEAMRTNLLRRKLDDRPSRWIENGTQNENFVNRLAAAKLENAHLQSEHLQYKHIIKKLVDLYNLSKRKT